MAEETIYKQELTVRNLQTRTVTLYPTRAQIVRDINNITLKVCCLLSLLEAKTKRIAFSLAPTR